MSNASMQETVFSWVEPGWSHGVRPRSLPISRVWGDVILELVAERHRLELSPPVRIRQTSLFAWLQPRPPRRAIADVVGRVRVELLVDSVKCAAAEVELVDAVLDPQVWRRLRVFLVDSGFDDEFITEDVPPLAEPSALALTQGARAAVETTRPDLLRAIVGYFEAPALAYLGSWHALADLRIRERDVEVVVPSEAVLAVTSG